MSVVIGIDIGGTYTKLVAVSRKGGIVKRFMDEYEWRPNDRGVEIVPAELGDEAGAIGSAKHAMERYDADRAISD